MIFIELLNFPQNIVAQSCLLGPPGAKLPKQQLFFKPKSCKDFFQKYGRKQLFYLIFFIGNGPIYIPYKYMSKSKKKYLNN